jgi:hypothetical protein
VIGLGPDFTKLWLAQAVSNVGDGVYVTALPLVAASLIRDPLAVSAVWRLETFKFSTDPGLEAKVRDVVGLYLDPQERAIVVCGDEKSQIQDVPDDEHESPKQLKRWTSRVQDRAREHRSAQLHAPFAAVTAAWLIESDLDADARRPGEDAATRRTSQERRRPGRVAAVEGQLAGLVVAADQQPGLPAWPSGARPWWSWSRRRNG